MSATQTVSGRYIQTSSTSRPTLGNLPSTIQAFTTASGTNNQPPTSNASLVPSAVFHPIMVPMDAQTNTISVTMESMMQMFKHTESKQDKILEKTMMTTISKNKQS